MLDVAGTRPEDLGALAHEIRTPLSSILGLAGLLADTPLDARQREYVRLLQGASRDLLDLLKDLLDLTRLEAGALDLEDTAFSLRDWLARTVRLQRVPGDESQPGLRLDLDPEAPDRLQGDPFRLQQVLRNLMSNAIRFSGGQDVDVRVRTLVCAGESVQVHLAVTDRGPGIPPESQELILEPFRQGDAGVARRHGGAGLGLALCNRIVRRMGGRLRVESEVGRGSTFHATLRFRLAGPEVPTAGPLQGRAVILEPDATHRHLLEHQAARLGLAVRSTASASQASRLLAPGTRLFLTPEGTDPRLVLLARSRGAAVVEVGEPSAGGPPASEAWLARPVAEAEFQQVVRELLGREAPGRPELQPVPGLRVLLVEDDPVARTMACALLERRECLVRVAANAGEARQAFRSQPFDLVLLDLHLPDARGDDLAAALRVEEAETGRRTSLVVLTASDEARVEQRCLRAGADRVLHKPLEAAGLDRLLAHTLPARPEAPEFDHAEALARMAGHESILRATVSSFLRTWPGLLEQARAALEREDRPTLERSAHSLRGGAALLGAAACASAALLLEEAAPERSAATLRPLLDRLEGKLVRLDRDLRQRVMTSEPGPDPARPST